MRVMSMMHRVASRRGLRVLGTAGLVAASLGLGTAATAQTSPQLRAAQTHKIAAPQVVDDPVLVEEIGRASCRERVSSPV